MECNISLTQCTIYWTEPKAVVKSIIKTIGHIPVLQLNKELILKFALMVFSLIYMIFFFMKINSKYFY